jgi:hypothetical protein
VSAGTGTFVFHLQGARLHSVQRPAR